MSLFQSSTCAAFSWDNCGTFRGVLIERKGNRFEITSHWQAKKTGNQSHAQLLENGYISLNPGGETTVVVGGNFSKSCFIDLKMPKIAANDLRNALYFELAKYTPIPIDEIQWGYRIVGKIENTEQYLIRVVYFSQTDWESWISASSAISNGVDMIIPAIAVLDPAITGTDVCLENTNGNEPFILKSKPEGEREIINLSPDQDSHDIFGLGDEPLRLENLNIGGVADLSTEIQRTFTTSIILAIYGVSNEFYSDRKQWLPTPLELRPKRNRTHKIYFMVLAVYLFFLSGIFISSIFYDHYQEYNELNAEYRRIKDKVDKVQISDEDTLFGDNLETELIELDKTIFSMARSLIEVTTLTSDELWSSNFNWDVNELRVELRTESEDSDITEVLQHSQILSDITMRKRQLADGTINYTINCRMISGDEEKPAVNMNSSEDPESPNAVDSNLSPDKKTDRNNTQDDSEKKQEI